jgi:CubicO group peptidase (beta-lactamase class C family)
MYATTADMARYVAALLGGGSGEHGSVLKPDTLASMFQPHFQPDPRVPGMGLGFEPGEERGHATVGKTGIVAGFLSAMVVAPDDGIGVVVFINTGGLDGRGVAEPLAVALLRRLLGFPMRCSAPTSRSVPKPGGRSAAGTAPIPVRSPTCSCGRAWVPAPRSPFTAATCC